MIRWSDYQIYLLPEWKVTSTRDYCVYSCVCWGVDLPWEKASLIYQMTKQSQCYMSERLLSTSPLMTAPHVLGWSWVCTHVCWPGLAPVLVLTISTVSNCSYQHQHLRTSWGCFLHIQEKMPMSIKENGYSEMITSYKQNKGKCEEKPSSHNVSIDLFCFIFHFQVINKH